MNVKSIESESIENHRTLESVYYNVMRVGENMTVFFSEKCFNAASVVVKSATTSILEMKSNILAIHY